MISSAPILRTVVSRDVTEHALNLSHWDQTYDQIKRGAFIGRLDELWVDDVQLFRERTSVAVLESGSAWPGSRTFGVPITMEDTGHYCGRTLPLDSLLTLGPTDALDFRAPPGLDIIGISLSATAFATFSRAVEGVDLERALVGRKVISPPLKLIQQFRTYLFEIFATATHHPERILGDAVRTELHDQLLERLVGLITASSPAPAESFTSHVRREIVNRARIRAAESSDQPLTVAALCHALKVSRRSLQYCFQEVLGVSPLQYLHCLRLNGLRRELQAATGPESVHEAAASWGFWHLSACAADYRKMFGELPSVTLRRHR